MSLKAKIEAIVYAAEEPVTIDQIASVLSEAGLLGGDVEELQDQQKDESKENGAQENAITASEPSFGLNVTTQPDDEKRRVKAIKESVRRALEELAAEYSRDDRAMEIRLVAGGYRMATKPEHHDVVRAFAKGLKPPMRLSLQALETLAVIAYKQPVTAPEISEIRGVDSGGVLGSLISRKLIATAGRKQVVGRPILYKTSKDFLLRFGLKDLSELPNMEEFEKLALESGDLFRRETDPGAGDPDATNGSGLTETPVAPDRAVEPASDNPDVVSDGPAR